jgi:hypothetical protein
MQLNIQTVYLRNALRLLRTVVAAKSRVEALACVYLSTDNPGELTVRGIDRIDHSEFTVYVPAIVVGAGENFEVSVNLSDFWQAVDSLQEPTVVVEDCEVNGVQSVRIQQATASYTLGAGIEPPPPVIIHGENGQTNLLHLRGGALINKVKTAHLSDLFESASEFCGEAQRGWGLGCVYVEHCQRNGVSDLRILASDGNTGFRYEQPGAVLYDLRRCLIPSRTAALVGKLLGDIEPDTDPAVYFTSGDPEKSDTQPARNGYDTRFVFLLSKYKGMAVRVAGVCGEGTFPASAFSGQESVMSPGEQSCTTQPAMLAKALKNFPKQVIRLLADGTNVGAWIEGFAGRTRIPSADVPNGTDIVARAELLARGAKAIARFGQSAFMYTHPSRIRAVIFATREVSVCIMPCDPQKVTVGKWE